jgi:hypothetical protein
VWTGFSTFDPTQGSTWGMGAGDSFTVILTSSSNNADILAGSGISADNFSIVNSAAVISSTVPEPGAGLLLLLCGAPSFAGTRRRHRARSGQASGN